MADSARGTRVPETGHPLVGPAVAAADAAARAGGVHVRELRERAELARLCELFTDIWRMNPADGPIATPEWLRQLSHAGNYISAAYDGETLVGGCIGIFAAPVGQVLHSHIAGVTTRVRGRNVGFALKLHQRGWALGHGITRITWTFDPLVRRNAYFNVAKLRAVPVEYLTNFYGTMSDGINAGTESDRILVDWRLDAAPVTAACAGRRPAEQPTVATLLADGAAVGLDADDTGHPVPGRTDAGVVLVAVPPDVERLRGADRGAAEAWRFAVREVLGGVLATGGTVTGFVEGRYVLTRPPG